MSRQSHVVKAIQLFWRQLVPKTKDKITYIGTDHNGNKYFESHHPNNPNPYRRYYEHPEFGIRGVHADFLKVPPPWDAWLRYRRESPPTDDELRQQEEYESFQQKLDSERKLDAAAALEAQRDPLEIVIPKPETGPQATTEKIGTFPKLPF